MATAQLNVQSAFHRPMQNRAAHLTRILPSFVAIFVTFWHELSTILSTYRARPTPPRSNCRRYARCWSAPAGAWCPSSIAPWTGAKSSGGRTSSPCSRGSKESAPPRRRLSSKRSFLLWRFWSRSQFGGTRVIRPHALRSTRAGIRPDANAALPDVLPAAEV